MADARPARPRQQGEPASDASGPAEAAALPLPLDRLPLMAFRVTPARTILDVNETSARQLGYTSEELHGRPIEELFHPDDRDEAVERFQAMIESGNDTAKWSLRKARKDGGVLWVREWLRIVRDEAGEPREVVVLCDDMSEDLETRSNLEESREQYRSLFAYSPDGVFSTDTEGRLTAVNPAAERIGGRPAAEVLGKSFLDFVAPADRDEARQRFRRALNGEPQVYELEIVHQDGHHVPILATKVPIIVRNEIMGVHGVFTDQTDRERAASLLRGQTEILEQVATGEDLRDILDNLCHFLERHSRGMLASVLLLDKDGLHLHHGGAPSLPPAYAAAIDGVAIGPNVGSCGTAAYHRRPVIVRDIRDDPRWDHYRDPALEHGLQACWSTPIFSASGDVLGTFAMYYRHPASPTEEDAELQALAVHLAGIAIERRRAEQARQEAADEVRELNERLSRANDDLEMRVRARTRELEAANQELERFSYTVAHDLRAPLRGVEQSLRMLEEDAGGALPEDARQHIHRAVREAHRLGRLVHDLLQLSKVRRSPLVRERVDLGALAHEVIDNLRRQDAERKVDVRIEDGLLVRGDPTLMRALLENLLGNAWKFSAKEPVARIEIASRGIENGRRVICVSDNGIGFDMAKVGDLFKPFQRLPSAAGFEGTGIGLAAVGRIVERHGGRIWGVGQPGAGATFCVTLESAEPAQT